LKISKTSWLVLTAGIFVIAAASLGWARSQQVNEQNQLGEELSLAEWRLSELQFEELSSRQEELERQLSEIISNLEAAQATLSQPTVSVTANDTLFYIAEVCGVEIIEVNSSDPTRDEREGITYSVLPLTATVEGEAHNLINFITRLNDDFSNGVVKSVAINIPEGTEADAETEEEQSEEEESEVEKPSANISLVIYTYRGG